jgi:GAF domain-containing protein
MPAVPSSGNGLPAAAERASPRPEAAAAVEPQAPVQPPAVAQPRAAAQPQAPPRPEAAAAVQSQAAVQPRVEAFASDPAHRPNAPAPVAASRAATREEPAPDPPEAVAGRLAERLGADAVALLLDNNRGLLEVAGGVGLTTSERQLQVEYGHEVLIELFRVGVGLIEDTERVRGLIRGIPGSRSQTLIMVPLVHEGHGFGALIVGRTGRPGGPRSEFTEAEIEALMDFAEDVAAPLRSTVLLRRLKGQLNTPDRS